MTDHRPQLEDREERLFRQVNPKHYPEGVLTSPVFTPTKNDNQLLSVDRGAKTTAERAHQRFTTKGLASALVLAVKVADFDAGKRADQALPRCPVYDDPNPPSDPENDAHAEADFRGQSNGVQRHRAKLLLDSAVIAFKPPQ